MRARGSASGYSVDTPKLGAARRAGLGGGHLSRRAGVSRGALDGADRVEVGYWLRGDAGGNGYATEAAAAAMAIGLALPGIERVEIRCDAANAPSAAIPRRLGFRLSRVIAEPSAAPGAAPVQLQVWEWPVPPRKE
jgi:RimJ/RimL family protein N-acetyltransferase